MKRALNSSYLPSRSDGATPLEGLIREACRYCGETTLKMTLDRRNNAVGHTKANVQPCCIRCNLIRRDMPYEAWLVIAPSVRASREAGLFNSWTAEIHSKLEDVAEVVSAPDC